MIATHGGVISGISSDRLPVDAGPPIFAFSLNRKLRQTYQGEYFRYRQASGGEFDYPSNTPNLSEDVFITTIYDQSIGYGVQHAVQVNQSLQPKLELVGSEYRAVFNQQEYLDVPGSGVSELGQDFTITARSDGDVATSPVIGIWSGSDVISIKPSDATTRFEFNSTHTILNSDGQSTQYICKVDKAQNNNRVLTIRTENTHGHVIIGDQTPTFENISIGRDDQGYYKGKFTEATLHLGNLTSRGSDQILSTTRAHYGN
jgi:hypothetical protein